MKAFYFPCLTRLQATPQFFFFSFLLLCPVSESSRTVGQVNLGGVVSCDLPPFSGFWKWRGWSMRREEERKQRKAESGKDMREKLKDERRREAFWIVKWKLLMEKSGLMCPSSAWICRTAFSFPFHWTEKQWEFFHKLVSRT